MVVGMAPIPKLTTAAVVDQAVTIVDDLGFDALSISAVAADLEVAPSALYTYCQGLDGMRNMVAIAATHNLTVDVRNAATGAFGDVALKAIGQAYRNFALRHPGQFASTLRPPPADNGDFVEATAALINVFVLVFTAMGLDSDESRLAARSTRSAIHGFLALEHTSGTSTDHAEEFDHLLRALRIGLANREL